MDGNEEKVRPALTTGEIEGETISNCINQEIRGLNTAIDMYALHSQLSGI